MGSLASEAEPRGNGNPASRALPRSKAVGGLAGKVAVCHRIVNRPSDCSVASFRASN